ncbi:hypothetical protein B9T34_02920 [Acinetobacter sp. ANC 3813]|nr:hypothetical protein B9T34_02920 [Acinetobacter sp. ANC 3813]
MVWLKALFDLCNNQRMIKNPLGKYNKVQSFKAAVWLVIQHKREYIAALSIRHKHCNLGFS